jgi:hypothetical protein
MIRIRIRVKDQNKLRVKMLDHVRERNRANIRVKIG